MIAYFRLQNTACMVLGGICGALAAWGVYPVIQTEFAWYARLFISGLFVLLGVVLGRIGAGLWAAKKCRKLYAILYQDCQPETFLTRFLPLVSPLPKDTIAYIDGMHQVAFAYEAMNALDTALDILGALEPEKLRLHHLAGNALVLNHKMRLYLLKHDPDSARQQWEQLSEIASLARTRAPTLAANLDSCLKIGRIWLQALQTPTACTEEALAYLREERDLATNETYRNEIQGLLNLLESSPIDAAAEDAAQPAQ